MTVTDTTVLEALLRRDRFVVIGGLVAVILVAWVWIVLGAIGLILAGMFLGAGIMRLWISNHAASAPTNSLVVTLFHILAKAIL